MDLVPVKALQKSVSLAEIKADHMLKENETGQIVAPHNVAVGKGTSGDRLMQIGRERRKRTTGEGKGKI